MIQLCALCETANKNSICDACYQELPWNTQACLRCALPLSNPLDTECGNCQKQAPYYDQTISLFEYRNPVDYLITQFKFNHNLTLGKILSQLLLKKLEHFYKSNAKPDIIIPIPLHRKRLIERGYNQSLELAKPIAKKLNLAIDYKKAKRIRNTPKQSELELKQRAKNVRGAFECKATLQGLHAVIIDDVITTGHTIQEFSHCLKKAGATRIDVWCIARTNLT